MIKDAWASSRTSRIVPSLSLRRTHNRRRGVARRRPGRRRSGELRLRPPQERLGRLPDDARRGRGKADHHQHGGRRRRARAEETQEGLAGNRPLHHLWQQDRLSVERERVRSASRRSSGVQGSDTGPADGGCCPADPRNIYLFIGDTNQPWRKAVTKEPRRSLKMFPSGPGSDPGQTPPHHHAHGWVCVGLGGVGGRLQLPWSES